MSMPLPENAQADGTLPAKAGRTPGRPRVDVDLAKVLDCAAQLFAERGYDAVSIEAVAERMEMSRATLYRRIQTKDELLAMLFERSTEQLDRATVALVNDEIEPAEELFTLVRLHVGTAIDTRKYMAVFFGGAGLPRDVYDRWRAFSHRYEQLWCQVVQRSMEAGVLPPGDSVLTTRMLLGMVIWVARWYNPAEPYSKEQIADAAVNLIRQRIKR
jgi:AcrR family transcriptional regulator